MGMDVVTFGETMVLFVPLSNGPLRFVSSFQKTIGGAESNVAIALARLGHQAAWFSRLGNDEFGRFVRNTIRGEGVDTSNVLIDSERQTAILFKERVATGGPNVYYYRKHSAASALSPSDIDERLIADAKYLHITGVTAAISKSAREAIHKAISIARGNQVKVVFDPNIRLKLWSKEEARAELLNIALRSDIILPGLDEGEILTGERSPEKITSKLLQGDCETVVIKLGAKGAYVRTKSLSEYVPGVEVKTIVDTVGAGDGFAAGFLSGQLRGWDLTKSVQLANQIGALALSSEGDSEGYPYAEDLFSKENQVTR